MAVHRSARPVAVRKIHFFRAVAGILPGGRPAPFDVRSALRVVGALSFGTGDRYLKTGDGDVVACWVGSGRASPQLRFGTIRRSVLPLLEEAGTMSPLGIPPRAGIAELVHVVFFPNNLVGADFNFYGPRMSRLAHYLREKAAGTCSGLVFEPLLRRDATARLRRLGEVKVIDLKVRASYAERVSEADASLGDAFRSAGRVGQAEDVQIVLRRRRYSREALRGNMLALVGRIARLPRLHEEASRFVVTGSDRETHQSVSIDVLGDALISTRRIFRQGARTRALDEGAAYEAIVEAHAELRGELEEAMGVSE